MLDSIPTSTHGRSPTARFGLLLALAAIVVNAPRLILVFLEAEGVPVGTSLRVSLLGLTGTATGVVLTGGGAFLAHAIARSRHFRRILAVVWVLVLVCTGVLITPMMAAGLSRVALTEVLIEPTSRWTWSAIAVLAVELVAAGSMVAYAGQRREQHQLEELQRELLEVAEERNQLSRQLGELRTEHDEHAKQEEQAQQAGEEASKLAASSEPAEEIPCRNACGATFPTPAGERGHQWRCPERPSS